VFPLRRISDSELREAIDSGENNFQESDAAMYHHNREAIIISANLHVVTDGSGSRKAHFDRCPTIWRNPSNLHMGDNWETMGFGDVRAAGIPISPCCAEALDHVGALFSGIWVEVNYLMDFLTNALDRQDLHDYVLEVESQNREKEVVK